MEIETLLSIEKDKLISTQTQIKRFESLIFKAKEIIIEEELAKTDLMDGLEFENYLHKILSANDFDVQVTKASGDQGVDLLAIKDEITYSIQAKRYSKPVGNTAIQEVHAGNVFYKTDKALVVTSNYFTHSARQLALKCDVELIDRMGLCSLIDIAIEKQPDAYAQNSYSPTIIEIKK